MSEGNSTNSWTILTPEETVAETLRPEGTQHHEESTTSTAGHTEPDRRVEGASSAVERLSVENQQVSEDKTPALSGDTPTITPTAVSDVPPPCALDIPGQSEGLPEVPAQSSPDPDSFSDSYTHINPSPDEPPASLLTTETLGASGLTQEEATPAQEGTLHPLNGEELGQEGEESEISQSVTDLGKQADSPVDSEVGEERNGEKGDEGETEMRRRSLLAALERIGRREEEDEEEEEDEFQLPQRDDDSGFSVNKCILGAVILLGLGTIFFSGVFMDLDEEGDYGARELRDAEVPLKQEWLNPEVPLSPVDADKTELLNKLAKGNQQFTVLQAQFQAQKDELKVAKGQAAEGAKERLRREEVERENGRLKKEMASLPLLQKENEKMKRELESVPALQKELETLKATVAELKLSTANEAAPAPGGPTALPPTGQAADSMQGTAGPTEKQARKPWEGEKLEKKKERSKEKYDTGEKKEWKEREKFEWKEGEKRRKDEGKMERKEKEWKKGKHEQGKYDQEKGKEGKQWRQDEEKKELKERGDWKKEKASRGDEGKPWKDREGKKEWKEKSDRKEWKERGEKKQWKDNDWKKGKQEKWNDGKEYRGKDEKKERKGGKDHGEWHKGKEEWKGEKEWKKGKDKESEKEKWVKKDWKEKGEKNEWKKDSDWKSRNGKDQGKEWKGKDERKQWGKKESKEGEWKREGVKEERSNGDWKKERGSFHKHKDESKYNKVENHHHHEHHKEHLWQGPGDRKPPQTHRQSSLEQPDYWLHQREKLQHNPSPSHRCDSVDTCAQAEGLIPVPLPEFEAVLQSYLAKAEGVGVDASKREELSKLATEFFKDGVFVHDQMSFEDFVEDVEDILEDMVEGEEDDDDDDDDGDGKDDSIEEEMDGFNREAMNKFSVPGAGQREERKKGEWRKESVRGRG